MKGYKLVEFKVLGLLLSGSLKYYVDQFWLIFMSNYKKDQLIGVIVKVCDKNGSYKCLGPLQKIHKTDHKKFLSNLQNYLSMRSNDYFEVGVEKIQFHIFLIKNKK